MASEIQPHDKVQNLLFYIVKHKDLVEYKSSCFENEKHQTRVLSLLELVSDAGLTGRRHHH